MSDVFTKAKRSDVMSKIRGRGNKDTEIALILLMRRHGVTGWQRNQIVFGKPDFVFRKSKTAVFVDGCFWHGCAKHCSMPVSNREFWSKKLAATKARERRVECCIAQERLAHCTDMGTRSCEARQYMHSSDTGRDRVVGRDVDVARAAEEQPDNRGGPVQSRICSGR